MGPRHGVQYGGPETTRILILNPGNIQILFWQHNPKVRAWESHRVEKEAASSSSSYTYLSVKLSVFMTNCSIKQPILTGKGWDMHHSYIVIRRPALSGPSASQRAVRMWSLVTGLTRMSPPSGPRRKKWSQTPRWEGHPLKGCSLSGHFLPSPRPLSRPRLPGEARDLESTGRRGQRREHPPAQGFPGRGKSFFTRSTRELLRLLRKPKEFPVDSSASPCLVQTTSYRFWCHQGNVPLERIFWRQMRPVSLDS